MFTKCFQNALELKYTPGISSFLKYIKGSTVPSKKLDHQAITASLTVLSICSEYVLNGEH